MTKNDVGFRMNDGAQPQVSLIVVISYCEGLELRGMVRGHAGDSRGTRGRTIPMAPVEDVRRSPVYFGSRELDLVYFKWLTVVTDASMCDEGSATRVEAQKVEVKGSRDGEKGKRNRLLYVAQEGLGAFVKDSITVVEGKARCRRCVVQGVNTVSWRKEGEKFERKEAHSTRGPYNHTQRSLTIQNRSSRAAINGTKMLIG